jgi:hypothetical protein
MSTIRSATTATFLLLVGIGIAGATSEAVRDEAVVSKAESLLQSEAFNQEAASELLLHPSLPRDKFVEIVRASGGSGKVMETLSLFASSPPLLGGKFEQVLEAVVVFPDSEAAKYLASNRYLEDYQILALVKVAMEKPDTELAGNLAGNLSLMAESVGRLAEAAMKNPASKLAERLAGSSLLPDLLQETFFEKAIQSNNSRLAGAFASNRHLSPSIKDRLGAVVIDSPESLMAKNFGLNSGLSSAQLKALATVAVALPDSSLAEGVGLNATLQEEHYETLLPAVKVSDDSKLAQSLASNPNIPDEVYSLLLERIKSSPDNPAAVYLASTGGAASTPARIANLANLVIGDPDVPYATGITSNPLVPQEFFDAMIQAALGAPKSRLCRSFMEDIKQKRFRGEHSQKMKIIEVSLTYGGG